MLTSLGRKRQYSSLEAAGGRGGRGSYRNRKEGNEIKKGQGNPQTW